MATACRRLVTFLPDRPLRNRPRLYSCIAFSTFLAAFGPYRRPIVCTPIRSTATFADAVPTIDDFLRLQSPKWNAICTPLISWIHSTRGDTLMSASALLLSLLLSPAVRTDNPDPNAAYMACARACADCQLRCDSCFKHCLGLMAAGHKEHSRSAELCADCAECCKLASSLTARKSRLASHACECCAKCCDECATQCEKFPGDDSMKQCASECRACAKACRDMVVQLTGHKATP